jgi:thiol:disulfide interchange protein
MKRAAIIFLACLPFAQAARAAATSESAPARGGADFLAGRRAEAGVRDRLDVRAAPSHLDVTPGQTFQVALDMRVADGWWYYSQDPGHNGSTDVIEANITPYVSPLKVEGILWPPHHRHEAKAGAALLVNNVFEGRAVAFVNIHVPADARPGRVPLQFRIGGQVCDENNCLTLNFPDPYIVTTEVVVASASKANPAWGSDIASAQAQARRGAAAGDFSFWAGVGLALLAGVILNIMPCVLPVIPLKVLSLIEQARESRLRMTLHGLAFAGGIMVFFVVLAAASATIRAATQRGIEWGSQFQSQTLRVAVSMIVVAVAANLFGLFNVNLPGFGAAAGAGGAKRNAYLSSVATGVLTAILATPCSFGYLTTALAWAQLQSLWVGTAALLAIGVGMAFPYVILTAFPGLLRRLPKPGRWMEIFKQSMGFVLLLVAVWLLSTLAGEDADYAMWAMAFGVVLAYGLWMWGSWVRYDAPARKKWLVRLLAAAIVAAAGWLMLSPPRPLAVRFAEFDRSQIDQARAEGRMVLIDFTARWCLTCKTVEYRVYDDDEVAKRLRDANVLAVRGDTTTADKPATRLLKELDEPGVPVSVLYPPGGGPTIRLHGIFIKADLFRALDEAGKASHE